MVLPKLYQLEKEKTAMRIVISLQYTLICQVHYDDHDLVFIQNLFQVIRFLVVEFLSWVHVAVICLVYHTRK